MMGLKEASKEDMYMSRLVSRLAAFYTDLVTVPL